MTVIGIDISKWNGDWDARKAKAAGAQFAFIKASQAGFNDPRFAENWNKARETGLIRGAYHYLDYTRPAAEQAKFFLETLADDPGELAPVVDFEQPNEKNPGMPLVYLRQFVEYLLIQGKKPIIYTSPAFWKAYGESATYWYQFPLWIANYTLASAPIVPPPWLSWEFWQFSKKGPGQLFGSEAAEVDINRFNGTLGELQTLAKHNNGISLNERILAIETRLGSIEKYLQNQTTPETTSAPAQDDFLEEIIKNEDWTQMIATPEPEIEQDSTVLEEQATPSNPEMPSESGELLVCQAQALNLRAGPGANYPVVGWLKKGQRIKVIERANGWVKAENPSGWSMEIYLSA